MLTLSARTGALAGRVGPRLPLSAGPVLIGAGLFLLTRVTPGRSYLTSASCRRWSCSGWAWPSPWRR